MPIYKYFTDECFAQALICRGILRFGSLASFRGLEDGGVRGDPKDGTLHYAPAEGLEITMVADGRKLHGTSFSSAVQNMFVYCTSTELSAELAEEFGPFCVEIVDPEEIVARIKSRASGMSKLDYAHTIFGEIEYRPYDQIPSADWAFPERVVLIKPRSYASQKEYRIALPLKANAESYDSHIIIRLGSLEKTTRLHRF